MINLDISNQCSYQVLNEDSRNTSIKDNSVDLICMHPPYTNVIKYSDNITEDLSSLPTEEFLIEFDKIAKESKRVLKPNKICSFMIGDIRKKGNVFPLGFKTLEIFLNNDFQLKEIIIKKQFNCKSTSYWKDKALNQGFYLLAHEYIYILKNLK